MITASLTALGYRPPNYLMHMQQLVASSSLESWIRFVPPVPRDKTPEILARHNVLLLPSEYQEPIARSMQEAMAMGLLVIGTTTGGSGELLMHQQTGLVFDPGNVRSLAEQLAWAHQHADAAAAIARCGQQTVQAHFGIQHTVAAIEQYLLGLTNREQQLKERARHGAFRDRRGPYS